MQDQPCLKCRIALWTECAGAITSRAMSTLIFRPAEIVLFLSIAYYGVSFESLTIDINRQMDAFARLQQSPPAGFITVRQCAQNAKVLTPPECIRFETSQKNINVVASEEARFLRQIYWILGMVQNYRVLVDNRRVESRPERVYPGQRFVL